MKKDEFEKFSNDCGIAYISDGTGDGENYKYVVYIRDIHQEELLGEIWGCGNSQEEALKQAFKNLSHVALKSIPVEKSQFRGLDFEEVLKYFQTENGFIPSPPRKIMPSFDFEGKERRILGVYVTDGKAHGVLY